MSEHDDYRNHILTLCLKHQDTVIMLQMIGAGGYIKMVITQGDKSIEARLNWDEGETFTSFISNLNSYMEDWNS